MPGSRAPVHVEDESVEGVRQTTVGTERQSQTVYLLLVALTLGAFALTLHQARVRGESLQASRSRSAGGSLRSSGSLPPSAAGGAKITEAEAPTQQPTSSMAPNKEPVEKAAGVWSRGSWARFRTVKNNQLAIPEACEQLATVDMLAVRCARQTATEGTSETKQSDLVFIVEIHPSVRVTGARCAVGCTALTFSPVVASASREPLVRLAVGAGAVTCAGSQAGKCVIGFDLAVEPVVPTDPLPPVCYLTIGDWGGSGVAAVASKMVDDVRKHFAKFIISTGDNFYPTGVKSIDDPLWARVFEAPFADPVLHQLRWFVVAGNHDQWGLAGQLQYGATHNRWYFPSRFYSETIPLFSRPISNNKNDKGKAPVQDGEDAATIALVALDFHGPKRSTQVAFADRALAAAAGAKNQWRVVVNHPPLFSGAHHGQSQETVQFRNELKPTLDRHRVHAYHCGHDHVLEVLRSAATDYFVSGSGGGSHMYTTKRLPESIWYQENGRKLMGYMRHCIQGDVMTTTLVDSNGAELYTHKTPFGGSPSSGGGEQPVPVPGPTNPAPVRRQPATPPSGPRAASDSDY